jgi:hypothetical protein
MIQRIQSLYLLLIAVLSLFFFNDSLINFIGKSGSVIKLSFAGIVKAADTQGFELIDRLVPLSVIFIIIPLLALAAIFFFKKRNIQMWLTKVLIGLVSLLILLSGYYSYFVITRYNVKITPGLQMVLPLLLLIFSVLAFRGIRKDDQLVKSYDRLR